MKKNILVYLSLLGISITSFGAAILLHNKTNAIKTDAETTYTAQTLGTMNINCNDTSEADIRSYYSALNSLSTSERKGTNLLKNLKPILSNGVKYYSYADVTYLTAITDRDWVNSPANKVSSTYGTYDSATNTIKNYKITNAKSESPYIHMLYVDYSIQPTTKLKYTNTTSVSFDKEHIWPKSQGFKDGNNEYPGAFSDVHHLTSGDPSVNQNLHGNYSYGIVSGESTVTPTNLNDRQGTDFDVTCLYKNKKGTALNQHSGDLSKTVFEPQDSDKGRIARACLYMVARYNNYAGATDDIGYYNPNLALVNYVTSTGSNVVSPSETSPAGMGIMQDLLYWNKKFPPDEWEIHRNNLIYNNFQHNRNPFIDYPEWADYIWGTTTYSGGKYTYSSVTTGYATPSTDAVSGFGSGSSTEVSVTSVSLNKTSLSLKEGENETLVATVTPSNATNQSVTWTSSNTSVATVSNGTVNAIKEGKTTITVKTNDGNKVATCDVTVTKDVTTPIEDSSWPFVNDVAYYMHLNNTGTGSRAGEHYFIGSMSGYYGATSTTKTDGVSMYFEGDSDGHYLYFKSGNTKNYIKVVVSGTYTNFTYSTTDKSLFTYNPDISTIVTDVNGTSFGLGTSGNYYTFGCQKASITTSYFAEFELVNSNTAYTFASSFLTRLTCNNGVTAPSKSIWSSLSSEYSSLETGWKNMVKNASSNETGTDIEKAVARYDYIVMKYGTSNYSNFIGRNVQSNQKLLTNNSDNNIVEVILVIVSVTSILSLGLLIKKSKQFR